MSYKARKFSCILTITYWRQKRKKFLSPAKIVPLEVKSSGIGRHVRSWYGENYMEKAIMQFAALCYEECLRSEIERVKQVLRRDIADFGKSGKDPAMTGRKQELLTWLNDMSFHELLSWYDAAENTEVSAEIRSARWSPEITERDRLFFNLLGAR